MTKLMPYSTNSPVEVRMAMCYTMLLSSCFRFKDWVRKAFLKIRHQKFTLSVCLPAHSKSAGSSLLFIFVLFYETAFTGSCIKSIWVGLLGLLKYRSVRSNTFCN